MSVNTYCDKLGIAVPDLDAIVATAQRLKLFYLMVVALIERGEPMTAAEIAQRLTRAGVPEVVLPGGLERALVKSWHGREPVYRLPDGRFALDLDSHELDFIVGILDLKQARRTTPPTAIEPPPGDEIPLSEEEVRSAFSGQNLHGLSALHQTAAVLDALRRETTWEEVEAYLQRLTPSRSHLAEHRVRRWPGGLVEVTSTGQLALNRTTPELLDIRRDIRKRCRSATKQRAEDARFAAWRVEHDLEHTREVEAASRWRRAVLHVPPGSGSPGAATVLDIETHTIRTFIGEGMGLVAEYLGDFDLLIGLRVRDALFRLNLDPARWRVVELTSAPKSVRLNRRGRTLKITPEMLIRSTTGISKPLGEPRQLSRYMDRGEMTKLRRRLESDAKALYAWYRYGVLHGYIRVRWGFYDQLHIVTWREAGEPDCLDILRRSAASGASVDVVTGSAPGWANPWARAKRGVVVGLSEDEVQLSWGSEIWTICRFDIQAVRIVTETQETKSPR